MLVKFGSKPGKRHSLYEANPMIIIVEQACVMFATGHEHILVLAIKVQHQRVQVILGRRITWMLW